MALPFFLALELALYAGGFVCGILTAASVTITQGNLGGQCMLYGTVSYNATARMVQGGLASPLSLCYFLTAISVLVAVTCFILSLFWLYSCCIDGEIGRDSLCSSIMSAVVDAKSCEQAQELKWVTPFDGHQFYSGLHKAETAVWVNFFFWVIIGVLVLLQRGCGGGAGGGGSTGERRPFLSRVTRTVTTIRER
ncbi:hypothetical protein CRUP_032495 [Coryphaenoides rupestris]|nr:hypothetical protein CRUP_032495 [Coryphaenoides rupestris]